MPDEKATCFVIMPFSTSTPEHTEEYWTRHFGLFLKPLIEQIPTLRAKRSEAKRGDILKQIITDLIVSPVVVADLTDGNPNVYWELGVRQSFKHGTVTIAQDNTSLPFDLSTKGTLFYFPKDHIKMQDFRARFLATIQDCLSQPNSPDSHVLETIGGRGTLFEIFRRDEAIRRVNALIFELFRHKRLLETMINQARKNQQDPQTRTVYTDNFTVSAVELLVTNQYLEENMEFYSSAAAYLQRILSLGHSISDWMGHPDSTERHILRDGSTYMVEIEAFIAEVTVALNKLLKS